MRPADTSPGARAVQLAAFRAMTPSQRLLMALEMSESARQVALAGIAQRHPEMTPLERAGELARILRLAANRHQRGDTDTGTDTSE